MSVDVESRPWETLQGLAQARDPKELEDFLGTLTPSEAVRALLRLDGQDQERVLTLLSPDQAADLIEDVPDEPAAEIIEQLSTEDAASILNEMESADQADLLGELDQEDAEAILAKMDPEEAKDARQLIEYDDHVAGGLMITEFLSYPRQARVEHVILDLSEHAEAYADFDVQTLFVTEPTGELMGSVELRTLVLADHSRLLAELVKADAPTVPSATPLEQLDELFDTHELAVLPVVDEQSRLVGIVRYSDVIEALADRAEENFMKTRGIVTGDEIRTMPVAIRSRRRLSWLSINIVLNVIAASVIALYQDTLTAVIALAVFLPIVSDMSGCSGNQAVAVSLRELTLGIVKPFEVAHVWMQEAIVGLINGLALGFLLGFVAWLWKGNLYLSMVVGAALMANTLVAVSIGGTVPLVLKRFGVDPAVASGPILTTITDMVGFFLLLSLATLMLPFLAIDQAL